MSKGHTKDLKKILQPFTLEQQKIVGWLREFVRDLFPMSNELIYDNPNAVAIGWSITDLVSNLFCTIAVGRSTGNIHFGFHSETTLADPKKILLGEGNQYRYLLVSNVKDFPKTYIIKLLKEAYKQSAEIVKDHPVQLVQGKTITKSISPVRREKLKKRKQTSPKRKKKS